MKGCKFGDGEKVICIADGSLEEREQHLFPQHNGIWALDKCWTKCISDAGDFVEKWHNMAWL